MASLTLTTGDQRQLARCLEILLSPLAYDELDDWRRAVNGSLKRLLRADMATFDLPVPGHERLLSDERDVARLRRYHDRLAPLDNRLRIFRRCQELGVSTRPMVWGRDLPRLHRSSYYNDYIVPMRCFDTLAAHIRYPRHRVDVGLYFHHDRANGRKFGERGLGLLRLAYPAFESAVGTWLALGRHRRELERVVDGLSQPAALYDRSGRLLHRNPAMAGILSPDRARVAAEAERLALTLAGAGPGTVAAGGGHGGRIDLTAGVVPATSRVRTSHGRYTLRATYVGAGPGARRHVLLTVSPPRRQLPPPRTLERRFGLTPRQAEVALLLARRKTNAEVAEALGISPHTARRHTEKVLLKLGVGSRQDVQAALTAPADD